MGNLGSDSDVVSIEFLCSFLRRHFAGRPVVASQNVGSCLLRQLTSWKCDFSQQITWGLFCVYITLLQSIDLFTDTAAILNLLHLRSIMGCPGGTHSVFTLAFRAKRELQCIFLGKKAFVITSKDGTTIFFSHYNLFLGKLKEKLARKARVNTDASISDSAHAPWASHNTP